MYHSQDEYFPITNAVHDDVLQDWEKPDLLTKRFLCSAEAWKSRE